MKPPGQSEKTADAVMLDVLAYEFDFDPRPESERKIKRRLRYWGLGPYRQDRVDLLRSFKDQVQAEIHRARKSRYYAGSHGRYAALEDIDIPRMVKDLAKAFPQIPKPEVAAFVPFAVYLYYLR
jgi:hypothetical protein